MERRQFLIGAGSILTASFISKATVFAEKTKTYQQAEDICLAAGLRLCTQKEIMASEATGCTRAQACARTHTPQSCTCVRMLYH